MAPKSAEIQELMQRFEEAKYHRTHKGQEIWSGRLMMEIFSFSSWQKFRNVIDRASENIAISGQIPEDHFNRTVEMSERGNGSIGGKENIYMTRYGAYMTVLEIRTRDSNLAAFAKTYFSVQTRSMEIIQEQLLTTDNEPQTRDAIRLDARERNRQAEKGFAEALSTHKVEGSSIGSIRNEGDKAFFDGKTTEDMRWKLGIGGTKRPIADFLPSTLVLAKALAASMTRDRVNEENLMGPLRIGDAHVSHNKRVRQALVESGIRPEDAEPEEDIRIVEKRHKARLKLASRTTIQTLSLSSEQHKVLHSPAPEPKEQSEPTHPKLFEDVE